MNKSVKSIAGTARLAVKTVLVLLAAAAAFCLFSACGISKPPREQQIKDDLMEYSLSVQVEDPLTSEHSYAFIESVSIEKRQTNGKADHVYCVVTFENETYRFTRFMRLLYNYYDEGGWILDDFDDYSPREWKLLASPFTREDEKLLRRDAARNAAPVGDAEISIDLDRGVITYLYPVREDRLNGYYTGNYYETLTFDGEQWELDSSSDLDFVWTLDGTEWTYYDSISSVFTWAGSTTSEAVLTIDSCDPDRHELTGSLRMSYISPTQGVNSKFQRDLPNEIDSVVFSESPLKIHIQGQSSSGGMFSTVDIYPNGVEAVFSVNSMIMFGPVKLECAE